ncbi:hypothetical protein D3C80_1854770 [compost metagenome]
MRETLQFQTENYQQLKQHRVNASHGSEGSPLIHAESPSYIADQLVLKEERVLKQMEHTKDLIGRVANNQDLQSDSSQVRSSKPSGDRLNSRRG